MRASIIHLSDFFSLGITKVCLLFFIFTMGGAEIVFGQTLNNQRTLTLAEMIALFKVRSKTVNRSPNLKGLNLFYEPGTRYPCVLSSLPSCPLLPISGIKGCYGEWDYDKVLYLKNIKGDNAGVCKVYEEALIKKYGKEPKGIPASWFTGKITCYQTPVVFLGDTLSALRLQLNVTKGIITEIRSMSSHEGAILDLWNQEVTSNQSGSIKISIYQTDNTWVDIYKCNSYGLTAFMNRKVLKIPANIPQKEEFSVLLSYGIDGKASLSLLSPSNPHQDVINLFNLLKEASKDLPLWCIKGLETIHGALIPGGYFRVKYENRKWIFINYL